MSGPMYFKPTPEQVAASRSSTCGMATPKDPSDCNKRCGLYAGKPCSHYRPGTTDAARVAQGAAA